MKKETIKEIKIAAFAIMLALVFTTTTIHFLMENFMGESKIEKIEKVQVIA